MTQHLTFDDFYAKWGQGGTAAALNEKQGAQPHFMDLCELLDVPKPGTSVDGDYIFEQNTLLLDEKRGFADVFKRNCFAWENKTPGSSLDKALKQLLGYSLALSNPPLLVVCDRLTTRIHTQFTGHPSEVHTVYISELGQPDKVALLRRVWLDPEWFRPKKTTRDITEAAAKSFATLAERLRNRGLSLDKKGNILSGTAVNDPEVVAHFLTQCLFCFFADDVELLPQRLFEGLVNNRKIKPEQFTAGLTNLFTAMQSGGLYGNDDIPWFNGGLFKKIKVPQLDIMDVTELRNAAALNWTAIDVSIFGTLFERGLDPKKRSQLGAHYTDTATIARIIDPVIKRPLLQKWELVKQEIRRLQAENALKTSSKTEKAAKTAKNDKLAKQAFLLWLQDLAAYRILDPACGSGNFLFLGLKVLKDIEHQSHLEAELLGLGRELDLVTGPHNMLGLELNEYAAELARVTVWIGELQWRLTHGYEFKTNPVLEPLDCIEHRDALLTWLPSNSVHPASSVHPEPVEGRTASEAVWPTASVVVGNPPFLGGSKKRRELGDANFEALDKVYAGRVPGGADLVCYWFDKALKAIENNGLGAAGFVATQAIRAGSNRQVLDAIVSKTRIFDAWADETWVNEGAAVRVSLISFGWGECCFLNGKPVGRVAADLTSNFSFDMTDAKLLSQNAKASFEGTKKYGPFDITGELARSWLRLPNPNGKSNSDVLKPWRNGQDLSRRASDTWIIDFGTSMSEINSALYEAPFAHVLMHVKPERMLVRRDRTKRLWWLHEEARVALRESLDGLPRYIATSRVSKHRFFVFLDVSVLPDTRLNVIARSDDTTSGILSSRFHEVWSLSTCSWIGVGNDPIYNAKSCFETFPFPTGLTPQDTAHQQTRRLASGAVVPEGAQNGSAEAIAEAAFTLNQRRDNWLNPPEWTQRLPEVVPLGMSATTPPLYPDRIVAKAGHEKELSERTLTKLYNARPAWLAAAHATLDAAVATAYGWADYTPDMPDETILQRLLALNVARSGAQATSKTPTKPTKKAKTD